MQIFVVEDEPKVGHAVQEKLQAEGYDVLLAGTREEGFFLPAAARLI
jgi:DNA-binding response OmpR family regulator